MCYHRVVRESNSEIYPTSTGASKFTRFEFCLLQHVGILREVYKTCITGLDLSTTPLTNGCHNDDMIQLGPLHSQSLFHFVQISDEYFEHLLVNIQHTL